MPSKTDDPCERPKSVSLGNVVITPGALACLSIQDTSSALARHSRGDWGDLGQEDVRSNDRALEGGGRLFSAYNSAQGIRFWVITEWDKSLTTILLPEEY